MQCEIHYLNLDEALSFPRNKVICLKNRKFWLAPTTTEFNIFYLNFAHVYYLPMSTKGARDFFFYFRSSVIYK